MAEYRDVFDGSVLSYPLQVGYFRGSESIREKTSFHVRMEIHGRVLSAQYFKSL